MTPLLDHRLCFPDPRTAENHASNRGLVAVGGDLSPERLLLAYRSGIFPWTVQPITWWSPEPRGILEFDRVHVSHRLEKTIRHQVAWAEEPGADSCSYQLTRNRCFRQVMTECATRRRDGNWITSELIDAYTGLHELGHAHSVECWHGGELAGGIYGVSIGGFFAGESMFYRTSNGSKIALWGLVQHLQSRGFKLFDVQVLTPTTIQLGGTNISRNDYLLRLASAVALSVSFED
ncbi:MAG: leucyl/phenylalanyl-tRNA--protein transferase [Opitutaceae bacterium]|nr:leucyl/phenylalanyl-tRNA--protein transferase [Verrucomicrobiales bacterium]